MAKIKKGTNPYGMPIIEISEINGESDEERRMVVEEIKKWLREKRSST